MGGVAYGEVNERYGICESYYTKLGEQAKRTLDLALAIKEASCAVILVLESEKFAGTFSGKILHEMAQKG